MIAQCPTCGSMPEACRTISFPDRWTVRCMTDAHYEPIKDESGECTDIDLVPLAGLAFYDIDKAIDSWNEWASLEAELTGKKIRMASRTEWLGNPERM